MYQFDDRFLESVGLSEMSEDQKEADKVIERINKIEVITAQNWDDMENKINAAIALSKAFDL